MMEYLLKMCCDYTEGDNKKGRAHALKNTQYF